MLKRNDAVNTDAGEQPEQLEQKPAVGKILLRGVFQFTLMMAVLLVGAFGMNYFTALKEVPPTRPPFKTVYTVDSVFAKQDAIQPTLKVYGEVQAAKNVDLRSLVAGKVIWVNSELKVGARLEAGEELFKIEPFEFKLALETAKANFEETKARIAENDARIGIETARIGRLKDQLILAQNDFERITSLQERGTATAKNVEDRTLIVSQRKQALEQSELNLVAEEARKKQLQAGLIRTKWAIAQAEKNLKDTVFLAPFSGILSEKNVAIGRLLGANDLALSMYESNRLEVRATLTDQRFGRIQSDEDGLIGRPVKTLWSVGGEQYEYDGQIERISAQIDSNRGGVEVIAAISELKDIDVLRPGAFVEMIVPDKKFPNHFRLPETSIYDGNTVYVIREDILESRSVEVHAFDGDHAIVSGEIADGEEILATRIAEISNDIRVKTQNTTPVTDNSNTETEQ